MTVEGTESRATQRNEEESVYTLADSERRGRTNDAGTQSYEWECVEKAGQTSEMYLPALAKAKEEASEEEWSVAATYAKSQVSESSEKGSVRDLADSDGDALPAVARVRGNRKVSAEAAEQGGDAQTITRENSNEHVQEEKDGLRADRAYLLNQTLTNERAPRELGTTKRQGQGSLLTKKED
ncbi:uncharacterized protein STEHIDRAFT_130726 [Stereum hirsutum FP-91666 SS1]|uniref:uncharacterized protein n=1 Tax=Stereum hirsutum (strain FP-91666) TaxID=721885 RepID=UPI000440D7CE|nr:uncharacterized protein STEHIDRAFT_130726 [Stereum hirsutum FP-91666 SS1]EIM87299.1 hypothetical protein STEHIDRAFT_130726 [Stereum hirsutum FP-91666 SS1]